MLGLISTLSSKPKHILVFEKYRNCRLPLVSQGIQRGPQQICPSQYLADLGKARDCSIFETWSPIPLLVISIVKQCGLLRIPCHTRGSLKVVLSVLTINRVKVDSLVINILAISYCVQTQVIPDLQIINRPGVAGAVLQTPPSLTR